MTHAQTILIVEDDPDIARLVQSELQDAGFAALTEQNAMGGLARAREVNPDLVILDLGLPDFSGAEVARRLRRTHDVPILILSAMDAVDRKIDLMSAGVNDYVTKPFNPAELVARVHVQLRRKSGGQVFALDGLEVDAPKRQCRFGDHDIHLTPREFDMILCFARQPGRVFSRADIAREVWHGELPESSNVIDVHIANLRGKLRDVGAYGLLRTVRGLGYGLRGTAPSV